MQLWVVAGPIDVAVLSVAIRPLTLSQLQSHINIIEMKCSSPDWFSFSTPCVPWSQFIQLAAAYDGNKMHTHRILRVNGSGCVKSLGYGELGSLPT